MEIKNLQTFLQVAESGSFTKTAELLGYTQSTISFQIKQLEKELDCLLFERIGHQITLTDQGKALLDYARTVNELSNIFRESFFKQDEIKGEIHLMTSDSICEMMAGDYHLFYKKYPHIEITFSPKNTDDMIDALLHNTADLIFTLDDHIYKNEFTIAKEEPINVRFVARKNHPLAKKKNIDIKELLQYPFLLTEKGMSYRAILDARLAKESLEVKPIMEIGRTDIIVGMLKDLDAISFLPEFTCEKEVQKGNVAYLDVKDYDVVIWKQLIYHKQKWQSQALKKFIEFLCENEFSIGK